MKRAMIEKDHMRRLEAVRDSNRRKTMRDAIAWLRQAARTPHEANMHRLVTIISKVKTSVTYSLSLVCMLKDRIAAIELLLLTRHSLLYAKNSLHTIDLLCLLLVVFLVVL